MGKDGFIEWGVEFSMFQRQLMVVASYYRKKTKDAYLNKEISGVNGMTSYVVNGERIVNSGIYSTSLRPDSEGRFALVRVNIVYPHE